MTGMHILEQTAIVEATVLCYILLISGILLLITALIVFSVKNKNKKKDTGAGKVLFAYGVGIAIILLSNVCKAETGRYAYTCTFDDNVMVKDISENFNVIGFENGIWKVEDKEHERD